MKNQECCFTGHINITDAEYAACIYCHVFLVDTDGGDAYTRGILDAINTLNQREQMALECYYRHGKTFKQTGNDIGGLSQTRAREIVQRALRKLRHPSRARNMSVARIINNRDKMLKDMTAATTEFCEKIKQFL